MASYFFANQGSSIGILREQGYMFTTYKDRYGLDSHNIPALANMQAGDVVVVNVDGLIGLATVLRSVPQSAMEKDFAEATNRSERLQGKMDFWRPGMLGLKVEVQFDEFPERIRYQQYSKEILAAQAKGTRLRQPFAKTGNANQETFYWLEMPLARVLMQIVGRPLPEVRAAALPLAPTPQPYVAKFASREIRPDQSVFRDRMIALWKKCPVTGVRTPALLDAAHFLDWRGNNGYDAGMLLNPLIHRAIDRDLIKITLSADGKTWHVDVPRDAEESLRQYDRMQFLNPLALEWKGAGL